MKIVSLITHPHVVPNPDLCLSSEHKLRYFDEIRELSDPPIDSNTTTIFKAQKGSKDIVKIVHVTWSYKNTFCAQKYWLFLTISSLPCQSQPHIHKCTMTHVCDAADEEPGSAAPCLQAEECTCMHRGTVGNMRQRLIRNRRNCWSYFCFLCAHKIFSEN